jgi:hypothetical protein
LANFEYFKAILDRFFFCEYPYSKVLGRKFAFTLKQWHNLVLLTLAQNPVIVLMDKKYGENYQDEVLPEEKWEQCLQLYREMFQELGITYYSPPLDAGQILGIEKMHMQRIYPWWVSHWIRGYGGVGGHDAEVILIAEVLSPLNYANIPFQEGPSGHYLSEILEGLPLAKLWITNWVKEHDDKRDAQLLWEEICHLPKLKKAILLGAVAKKAAPILRRHGIEYEHFTHPSAIVRFQRGRKEEYKHELREAILDGLSKKG